MKTDATDLSDEGQSCPGHIQNKSIRQLSFDAHDGRSAGAMGGNDIGWIDLFKCINRTINDRLNIRADQMKNLP